MTSLSKVIQDAKDKKETDWLITAINQGYTYDSDLDQFKQKTSFAPSSLFYGSGTCPKRWVIAFNGAEHKATTSPSSLARMEQGRDSHERIQRALKHSGLLVTTEDEVICDDPPIRGYLDAKAWNNEPVIIEIKTVGSQAYLILKNSRIPTKYHLYQLLLYMYLKNVDRGVLLYENRDSFDMLPLPVIMTEEYRSKIEGVLNWCREVYGAYKSELLPRRGFRQGSKVCNMCPVEAQCDQEEGTLALPKLPM